MLRIARFVTRCQAPQGRSEVYSLADSIVREQLAGALAGALGPSLSRQTGVVRIKRLRVRIEVRGRSIDRGRLIEAWVRALTRQLFTALAYPHGGGHFEIERAASPAHFRAGFLRDLLSGTAPGRWIHRDREALLRLTRADAVMAALREDPSEIVDTLAALAEMGSLEGVVTILDDLALEEIFRAIAATGKIATDAPPEESLAQIARALKRHPPSRGLRLDSRAQALRLFVLDGHAGVQSGPRVWLTVLTALALLAEYCELWTASPHTVEQICGRRLSPHVVELLEFLRPGSLTAPPGSPGGSRTVLLEALHAAGLKPPEPAVTASALEPWRDLDGASLLLLTGPLASLGWVAHWPGLAAQFTLYALAGAIRGVFDPGTLTIDPNAAFFAGIFGEPSLSALRQSFAESSPPPDTAADWRSAADLLAARLIAWWTQRLPGFRKATRTAIVRQFLTSPGRVRVEEARVVVELAANPVFVALRIASLDAPVENVSWFGGRRLEFRIEGV
jgi:hypothetical protein